jgi:soluble lytic murein transglycosylase-like protein
MWKGLSVFLLTLFPSFVTAAGLVPCGGPGEPVCQFCHVVQLVTTVSGWLVAVLGTLAAIVIVVMGLRLVTSGGDVAAKTQARRVISNVLVGYVILLSGWLIINQVLRMLANNTVSSSWNTIQCVAQPVAQAYSRPTASGDSAAPLSSTDVTGRVAAIASSGSLQADIAAAAAAAGIRNPDDVKTLKALISQESGNCTNKVGPATAFGTAYGCGQMLIGTARGLDPSLSGLSDADVAARLRDDNAYNLTLSAKYYNQLLNRYNGQSDLALAAYNGGYAANQPSNDCPGQRRWQCVWDSPGCYGTGRTDCARNEGPSSYAQTRHYVSNINAVAEGL